MIGFREYGAGLHRPESSTQAAGYRRADTRVGNGVKEVVVDGKQDALAMGVAAEQGVWRMGSCLQQYASDTFSMSRRTPPRSRVCLQARRTHTRREFAQDSSYAKPCRALNFSPLKSQS
jgi:hypothetical protein